MPITERLSVSIHKDRAAYVRDRVANGKADSVSSLLDEAVELYIDRERAREEWWAETIRRCDEAEKHPERLLDAATFHKRLWDGIAEIKKRRGL